MRHAAVRQRSITIRVAAAFALGLITACGFAPLSLWPLTLIGFAGLMWLEGVKGDDKVFYTTGRLTSEMVIKGAQMGIPFLLSRSGTTQMGHMVAQKVGMSLLARCSGKHFPKAELQGLATAHFPGQPA